MRLGRVYQIFEVSDSCDRRILIWPYMEEEICALDGKDGVALPIDGMRHHLKRLALQLTFGRIQRYMERADHIFARDQGQDYGPPICPRYDDTHIHNRALVNDLGN